MPELNVSIVKARDLPDLWFQTISKVLDEGRRFVVDRGSYAGQTRLEFDYFMGIVENPSFGSGTMEILPQIPKAIGIPNPVELGYIYGDENHERSYIEYLMTSTLGKNESYTYGERLCNAGIGEILSSEHKIDNVSDIIDNDSEGIPGIGNIIFRNFVNQIELIIWTYKNKGHRNNQMVLQVASPNDCMLKDPPCLRHIDTRIQDNMLHFYIYFRSWDLWGGLPANLAGIETLHKYMADEIGVGQGSFIVESKGLHLYGYAEDLAAMRTLKSVPE